MRAEVEGLGTLEFPDGTDPKVIQSVVKRELAKANPKFSGNARGMVADVAMTAGSNLAQRAVGLPKHLANLAEQVTEPLSRMSPEDKAKAAKADAKPGVTERLQALLQYTPKTPEGRFLLGKIQQLTKPINDASGALRDWSEEKLGKPVTDVASDALQLAGLKGALPGVGIGAATHIVPLVGKARTTMAILRRTNPQDAEKLGRALDSFERVAKRVDKLATNKAVAAQAVTKRPDPDDPDADSARLDREGK
jgi:hypothetical protein